MWGLCLPFSSLRQWAVDVFEAVQRPSSVPLQFMVACPGPFTPVSRCLSAPVRTYFMSPNGWLLASVCPRCMRPWLGLGVSPPFQTCPICLGCPRFSAAFHSHRSFFSFNVSAPPAPTSIGEFFRVFLKCCCLVSLPHVVWSSLLSRCRVSSGCFPALMFLHLPLVYFSNPSSSCVRRRCSWQT